MGVIEDLLGGFERVSDRAIYRDIINSDYWTSSSYLDDEKESGYTEKEIIEQWMEARRYDFESDFSEKADEIFGKLIIYRCIDVADPEEFAFMIATGAVDPRYSGLGIYWSWDLGKAECHWGEARRDVFIKGLVDPQYIDIKTTVLLNMDPNGGAEEAEIRLKEGAPVEIVGIGIEGPERDVSWIHSETGQGVVLPA